MSKLSQHEKEHGTYFCVVTNDIACRDNIKASCLDFPYWAWIDHLPDNEEGSPHTHFLLRNTGTRSIKQMSDRLAIPSNYIQVCRKVTAFRRYMMHLDDPDKICYSINDIHTNKIVDFQIALEGNVNKDIFSLYRDFSDLSHGIITPQEFLERNYSQISQLTFSQQLKTFDTIHRNYQRLGLPDSPNLGV